MSRKKRPRDEWIDPTAPTELMGETAAVQSDLLHYHIPNLIEELAELGVNVKWTREPDDDTPRIDFQCDKRLVAKVARAAYRIGASEWQAKALTDYLDSLSAKRKGNRNSNTKRVKKASQDGKGILKEWARRVAKGDKSVSSLAKDLSVSPSKVYRHIRDFKHDVQKMARTIKAATPSLSTRDIQDHVVKQFAATTTGLNRHTVSEALKRLR